MKTKTLARIDETATTLQCVISELAESAVDHLDASTIDWHTIESAIETLTAAHNQLLEDGPDYLDAAEAFIRAGRGFIGTLKVKDGTPKLDAVPMLPLDSFVHVEADCS